jgi:hypothetical protein
MAWLLALQTVEYALTLADEMVRGEAAKACPFEEIDRSILPLVNTPESQRGMLEFAPPKFGADLLPRTARILGAALL